MVNPTIGIDIVQVSRIRKILEKYNDKFLVKFFNSAEIEYSSDMSSTKRVGYFAKRFAAREAIIKARGTSTGLILREICIKNDSAGKPTIYFMGKLLKNSQISLSDDGDYAIAFVLLGDPL